MDGKRKAAEEQDGAAAKKSKVAGAPEEMTSYEAVQWAIKQLEAAKAKADGKAAAKKAAEESEDSDDEPAPKAKAKAKAAAKKAAEESEDSDDEPAPKAKAKAKAAAKKAAEESEDSDDEKDEEPPAKKARTNSGEDRADQGTGGKGKGKDKGAKGQGKGDKGGKGERSNENTVFIRGLSFDVEEDTFRKDFEECGEIQRCTLPKGEDGRPKGIAFVAYATKEGFEAALKFDATEYGGRTIYVSQAGEGGKGKDGKGKDGKGKDGKGKGKKGKGKGMSSERMAAKDGSMVESTGTKQTFADSDDE